MTRIFFFDTPIDLLDMDQTVALADAAMAGGEPVRHTAINVAKLVKLIRDPELAEDVCGSDVVGIDGMGIVYGLKLFGLRDVERVAGVDLMLALMDHCARTGRRPYVLGARQEQLDKALAEARDLYPDLTFAGSRNGYFGSDEEPEIVADIRASGADCLFVAMPTPRKERFLKAHAAALGVPFVMGVGGAIDVLAGHISRAPQFMQKSGLEWFHRMVKEPRKLVGRYATTNTAYAGMLLSALLRRRNPVSAGPTGRFHPYSSTSQ